MTTTPASRLLISHIPLRGPELAQIYAAIVSQPEATLDNLRDELCTSGAGDSPDDLADAPLRETISFLTIAGLVEVKGRPRRHTAVPHLRDMPFPLLLTHHVTTHPEERQRAMTLIYRHLVADDTLAITSQTLRDQMERGVLRDLFAWTGEKLLLWAHLAAFIGLIRRVERSTELLIVPQTSLILDALRWASTQSTPLSRRSGRGAGGEGLSAEGEGFSLATALTLIDTELFACFTARGRIHRGLAQTLLAMERLGHIRMTHHADAAHSLLLGERRVSEVALTTSRIATDNSLQW